MSKGGNGKRRTPPRSSGRRKARGEAEAIETPAAGRVSDGGCCIMYEHCRYAAVCVVVGFAAALAYFASRSCRRPKGLWRQERTHAVTLVDAYTAGLLRGAGSTQAYR